MGLKPVVRTLCDLASARPDRHARAADRVAAVATLAGEVASLARAQEVAGLVHGVASDLLARPGTLGAAARHALDAVRALLAPDHRRTVAANLLRLAQLQAALDALAPTRIPVVVLKGAYLIETVHAGDPGRRPMMDVDVLVPPADFARALAALRAAGFAPRGGDAALEYPVVALRRSGVDLELHDRVARAGRLHVTPRDLFARAVPLRVADRDALALAPEDALVHLCVHLAEHAYIARLRWVADVAWLAACAHPPLDWDALRARARAAGAAFAVHRALTLAGALLGADVPPALLRDLAPGRLRSAWYDLLVDHRSLRFSRLPFGRAADLLLALPAVDRPRDALAMVMAFARRRLAPPPRPPAAGAAGA
jgi:hypothetical protein